MEMEQVIKLLIFVAVVALLAWATKAIFFGGGTEIFASIKEAFTGAK